MPTGYKEVILDDGKKYWMISKGGKICNRCGNFIKFVIDDKGKYHAVSKIGENQYIFHSIKFCKSSEIRNNYKSERIKKINQEEDNQNELNNL